ncbi:MAG: hypothetical protein IPM98_09095 [Lewinellaceae bacterium]|nr:hypothetical protein [Lewinellaceae bacterium]
MKFEIVKLENLSGVRATVYSVTLNDETHTLFERFIVENRLDYINELKDIGNQIRVIAHKTGIRDNF